MMNQSKVVYLTNLVEESKDASYDEFIECVEQMLVFHAFVTQKTFWWSESVSKSFDQSLRNMMRYRLLNVPLHCALTFSLYFQNNRITIPYMITLQVFAPY